MKPSFDQLSKEDQLNFGNGCSGVPDFIFTASCQRHDYAYARGYRLRDKIKADFDMCRHMWHDCQRLGHYVVTILYWLGLTFLPVPYLVFGWGKRYRTNEEIMILDKADKIRRGIM